MCEHPDSRCPLCEAAPGHPCLSWRGTVREPHADRPVSPDTPRPKHESQAEMHLRLIREWAVAGFMATRNSAEQDASFQVRQNLSQLLGFVRQEEAAKHQEVIGKLRALMMTLMDVAKEGASGAPQYDFKARAESAAVRAQTLLMEVPR